jgi:sulfatase maturation enzyme AslB (radical SAM superfamily)
MVCVNKKTIESFLLQWENNKLFSPLTKYLSAEDVVRLFEIIQDTRAQKYTIAELKDLLASAELPVEWPLPQNEIIFFAKLFKENKQLNLPMFYIAKLTNKTFRKLLCLNKYCFGASGFLKRYLKRMTDKNAAVFLPVFQAGALLAAISVLPAEQKVTVVILDNLESLIGLRIIRALNCEIKKSSDILPNSASLIMSENCNLRCAYCYEQYPKRKSGVLTFEKAQQALSKFDHSATISFSGGEPMLHIDLMKKICEWGWEYHNFTFQMTTNGQIIDQEFFREYAKYFTTVQLSVDGPEEVTDLNRGSGSFKKAMEFYRIFKKETGKTPKLVPVLSKQNLPQLLSIVQWFYEFEICNNDCTAEPALFSFLPGDAGFWTEIDYRLYAKQLVLVKDWYIQNNIRDSKFLILAFAQAERDILAVDKYKNIIGGKEETALFCSAGNSSFTILPTGELIPCHRIYHWQLLDQTIDLAEDSDGLCLLSEICLDDLSQCKTCRRWGCYVCPGQLLVAGRNISPDFLSCRASKILIEIAEAYVEELAGELKNQ